ncbi:MAG: iron-containing alcohol dehydrogenase [Oscillospiraceae bacterium]|nr:iron-containing alcohol dehydrogenase [Oscillospiraceae bacterium]
MPHFWEVIFCRSFQAVLKIGNYFLGYHTPEYLEGAGTVRTLGAFLKEKGINDVLVVTGQGMIARGQVQPMLDSFTEYGIRYTIAAFDRSDPDSADVERGYGLFRDHNCKAIVAIGGGSRIDCAKAIAAKAAHPKKTVARLQGILTVHKRIVPLIAIPTTAGAGSETTVAAVVTDTATHRKAAINDPFLTPKYAVLDPELTVSLPPYTTAATGMDALSHAVEAYVNQTYNTPLENRLAKEAVRLIHGNIHTVCADGSNITARQNMQKAAFYAGRAFTRGCVGYVHAIGHTLGSLYGIDHGTAMAALLPRVMGAFGTAAHPRLAELAEVCGLEGSTAEEKATAFLNWIEDTNRSLGLPEAFPMIQDAHIPQMIRWARKEAHPLYPVPVIWTDADFHKLITSLRK